VHVGTDPLDFIWATGIEDTFVPQARARQRPLDEYELMGHYEHWREDLALVGRIGARAVRWGVPWYRIELEPGRFDWSWTDHVIPYLVEDLGVTPIIDLIHYGCPLWMPRAFVDPAYPARVALFARAFAERYRDLVHWYTPLNEPHMTALMCGQRGVWPPYLRGERGYVRVMLQLVRGMSCTVDAIREVDPDAIMVMVDAAALHRAAHEDLSVLAAEEHQRRYLTYDLLLGRVRPDNPIFPWLIRNGAGLRELEAIARHPVPFDVMGLNFYPQWSTHQLYVTRTGRVRMRASEQEGSGFAELIEGYFERYHMPVMVTETSAYGPPEVRSRWLETSVSAIKDLRGRGVPVVGYTWFPLFTMVDWRYRFGGGPVEEYHIELGLFSLDAQGSNGNRWQPTSLISEFQAFARDPADAVGFLPVGELSTHG
jgi:beta-glucosidase